MVKNRKLLAEQLVEESVVLLKNENQLLPLQEGQTVAVFGRSALVTYVSGNGSGAARGAESSNIIIELEKAGDIWNVPCAGTGVSDSGMSAD